MEEEEHSSVQLSAGKEEMRMEGEPYFVLFAGKQEMPMEPSVLLLANQEEDMALEEAESRNKEEDKYDDEGGSSHRSSDKSTITTEDERSDREEEEPGKETRKRKLEDERDETNEEEEEEVSDEEYDSSDDDESAIAEEENKEEDTLTSEELLNEYGVEDADIMSRMEPDKHYTPDEKIKLLPQLRRYLKSIYDTEGYDCTGYPGVVFGVTSWIPLEYVFKVRDRYPEGYHHLMYMSSLALHQHNEKFSTQYKVVSVENATSVSGQGYQYKITFSAVWKSIETFQACVWDDVVNMKMEVLSCRIKAPTYSCISSEKKQEEYEKSVDENDKSDPVERITTLNSYEKEQIYKLIREDPLSTKVDENILFKKLRKYFDSVVKSQGFNCSYYPGHMPGLTDLKPRQKIINETTRFPEGYFHLRLMAKLSLDSYMKHEGASNLKAVSVESVNSWKESSSSYIYYVTFKAMDLNTWEVLDGKFEAKVRDKRHQIDVLSCRLSP